MKLCLKLFHGRTSPDQDMDDWGSDGPLLGPLDNVHVTYMCNVVVLYNNLDRECTLAVYDDLIYYDGTFYGDWGVMPMDSETSKSVVAFDPDAAVLPLVYKTILEAKHAKNAAEKHARIQQASAAPPAPGPAGNSPG